MPIWLQACLPIFTALLGGGVGFAVGRANKALDRRLERRDAEKAKAPAFVITHEVERRYRFSNTGTLKATNVKVDFIDCPTGIALEIPDEIDLESGASFTFLLRHAIGMPWPDQALVTCDQLPAAVPVMVPYR